VIGAPQRPFKPNLSPIDADRSLLRQVAGPTSPGRFTQYVIDEGDAVFAPRLRHFIGMACDAAERREVPHDENHLPMRGSEDFGRFGKGAPAGVFLLGAGENHPNAHNPDRGFPAGLTGIGARDFMRTLSDLLG
jgi:metal-dependent amidase/aminoacylase/carboxypeptidase family protein